MATIKPPKGVKEDPGLPVAGLAARKPVSKAVMKAARFILETIDGLATHKSAGRFRDNLTSQNMYRAHESFADAIKRRNERLRKEKAERSKEPPVRKRSLKKLPLAKRIKE